MCDGCFDWGDCGPISVEAENGLHFIVGPLFGRFVALTVRDIYSKPRGCPCLCACPLSTAVASNTTLICLLLLFL